MDISSPAAVAVILSSGVIRHDASIAMVKQAAEAERSVVALIEQATQQAKQSNGQAVDILV